MSDAVLWGVPSRGLYILRRSARCAGGVARARQRNRRPLPARVAGFGVAAPAGAWRRSQRRPQHCSRRWASRRWAARRRRRRRASPRLSWHSSASAVTFAMPTTSSVRWMSSTRANMLNDRSRTLRPSDCASSPALDMARSLLTRCPAARSSALRGGWRRGGPRRLPSPGRGPLRWGTARAAVCHKL